MTSDKRQTNDGLSTIDDQSVEDTRPSQAVEKHERLDRIRDEILRLGLERHVLDLELYGYTILENVKPLSFFDELRETILRLGEEDRAAGRRIPLSGKEGKSYLVTWLLARGPPGTSAVRGGAPVSGSCKPPSGCTSSRIQMMSQHPLEI